MTQTNEKAVFTYYLQGNTIKEETKEKLRIIVGKGTGKTKGKLAICQSRDGKNSAEILIYYLF